VKITVASHLFIASSLLFRERSCAVLVLVVCSSALVAAVSSDYATPMAYARPTAYAQLTYSAPSYDVHDVVSALD